MRASVLLQLTLLHYGCWVTSHKEQELVRSVFEDDPLVTAHLAEEGPDWSLVPRDPECDHHHLRPQCQGLQTCLVREEEN